jgi:hypothetical protein
MWRFCPNGCRNRSASVRPTTSTEVHVRGLTTTSRLKLQEEEEEEEEKQKEETGTLPVSLRNHRTILPVLKQLQQVQRVRQ